MHRENKEGTSRSYSISFPLVIRSTLASNGESGKSWEDEMSCSSRPVESGDVESSIFGRGFVSDSNKQRGDTGEISGLRPQE